MAFMNGGFIDQVSQDIKYTHKEIVEKDLYLHDLLSNLFSDQYFKENFLFKGGTCLVKCYLGYYRFSEDIDFTWKNQDIFNGLSVKQQKKIVDSIKDETLKLVDRICKNIGLNFDNNKSNKKYIEFSGNEMRMTLKTYYDSIILNTKSFIKIQINFLKHLSFENQKLNAQNLLLNVTEDTKLLFPEDFDKYSGKVLVNAYNINEIVVEKVRALLTRTGAKARDYVDLYFISQKYQVSIDQFIADVIKKIQFATKRNQRYRNNFLSTEKALQEGSMFKWGDEEKYLLTPINTQEFDAYVDKLENKLRSIIKIYHKDTKK
jgi:predicted nucleotidyltransferase component of viral defense system